MSDLLRGLRQRRWPVGLLAVLWVAPAAFLVSALTDAWGAAPSDLVNSGELPGIGIAVKALLAALPYADLFYGAGAGLVLLALTWCVSAPPRLRPPVLGTTAWLVVVVVAGLTPRVLYGWKVVVPAAMLLACVVAIEYALLSMWRTRRRVRPVAGPQSAAS
jgi:hypothetical protein